MPISRGACREFLEDFSTFVDGTLNPHRRSLLIAHLDCCETCLRHLRAYRKGVATLRESQPDEPVGGLYDRVSERLQEDRSAVIQGPVGLAEGGGWQPSRSAVGAALATALLALFVVVPQAGRIGRSSGGPEEGTAATVDTAPTSYASVIPAALPSPGIAEDATDGLRSSGASSRPRALRSDIRLALDHLPEVPRRQIQVARLDDFGGTVHASGSGGWSPRRPPIVIDRRPTASPAAWVAEAALRIP